MAGDETIDAAVVASSAARKNDILEPPIPPGRPGTMLLNPETVFAHLAAAVHLILVCNQSKSNRRAICHLNETACPPKLHDRRRGTAFRNTLKKCGKIKGFCAICAMGGAAYRPRRENFFGLPWS
ncbi:MULTISPECIES: hypothetical protein [unclassified Novosphingobium]|uniref:hypothetical protein n=1 Tax=unclassified Novosphingobium TaxID=2644732 RepID=UPI00146F4E83|nr:MULTISPECIES: hypothetical protein [unclassified Novosphingobium]NKJ40880.1 hypothetical protein [Novosphingobium sp. SG720]NMN86888.1 hypothetical protein [Novosphingobium sp. SG916]